MIVDDSTVARAVLARMVAAESDFEVVALAGNAGEALDALKTVPVDIVLLDVEMPGTSGLEALPRILAAGQGARVLIVSSMAEDGAEVAVRALAAGAADTLPKPGTGCFAGRFSVVLADRLRRIGRAARGPEGTIPAPPPLPIRLRAMPDRGLGCVALGASTGGLRPLVELLGALPARIGAPILVTQHLPAVFMPVFARQLAVSARREAVVAEDGMPLVRDRILVAPGDAHLTVDGPAAAPHVRLSRQPAPKMDSSPCSDFPSRSRTSRIPCRSPSSCSVFGPTPGRHRNASISSSRLEGVFTSSGPMAKRSACKGSPPPRLKTAS
mgnify:CR=1 FL=1